MILAPDTGTWAVGVEAAPEPVGAAAPLPPLAIDTTAKGFSVQDVVGRADRVTMSGVVTAEGQELQVIVVDAESAAWTPDRTAYAVSSGRE